MKIKVYRLLLYDGDIEWIDKTLQQSLNQGNDGVNSVGNSNKIVSKIISTFDGDYLFKAREGKNDDS